MADGQPPNQLNTGAVRSFTAPVTVPSRPPLPDDAEPLGDPLVDDDEPVVVLDCCDVDGDDGVVCWGWDVLGADCVVGADWPVVAGDCVTACDDEVVGLGVTLFVPGCQDPEMVPWAPDEVFERCDSCWTPCPDRALFEPLACALDGTVASDCDGTCGVVVTCCGAPLSASTMSPPDSPPDASVPPGVVAEGWLRNRLPTTAPSASTAPAATPLSALRVARDLA